jgi:outer membrane protein TolC
MVEAETQLIFERERMLSHIESASSLVMTSQMKLDAAKRRSTLATETRQFFDKAFRFGETDLPTRLRVELEATEANRQAALAQINFGVAVSNLRQALGLLPE